jgi:hypothetical protein
MTALIHWMMRSRDNAGMVHHEDPKVPKSERSVEWVVWRQGDDGNPFEVARLASRSAADDLVSELEARGHRQVYWVEPPPS